MGSLLCECKECFPEKPNSQIIFSSKIKKSSINNNNNTNTNNNNNNISDLYTSHRNTMFENKIDDDKKNNIDEYENDDLAIIELINEMRKKPDEFRESMDRKNNINEEFEKIAEEEKEVSDLLYNENLIKEIRNIMYSNKNVDLYNIKNTIIKDNSGGSIDKFFYFENIVIKDEEVEENVWKFLENNREEIRNILQIYTNTSIVTVPYGNEQKKTYYFFYSFK